MSRKIKPGYKQTEVGVIPVDWEPFPIGDHVEIRSGESPSRYTFGSGTVPYFKVEQVGQGEGSIGPDGTPYFVDCTRPIQAGSIIFPKRGASILLNRVRVLETSSFMDTNLMTLTTDESLDSSFLQLALLYFGLFRVADTTSIPQINNKHIRPLLLPAPSTLSEQCAIAEALGDADALVESLEQLVAKKRRIKQGTMQELLTGKNRLPGFEGKWVRKMLGDVVSIRNERVDPRVGKHSDFCIELEHISQGTGCLLGHTETTENSSLKCVFEPGDVLFGKLRAYLRKFWYSSRRGVCSTEIWVLLPSSGALISTFLYQIVQTERFIESASVSFGTHMPRSDWEVVKMIEMKLPPPPEQTAIATVLSDMDEEIAALEAKLAKARQVKQGMMQELLTGKTRLI